MKINFLIFDVFGLGGTVRTVLNVAEYLVEAGYDVTIISVFKKTKKANFEINPKIKLKFLVNNKKKGLKGNIKGLLLKKKSILIHKDDEAYSFFNLFSDIRIMKELRGIREGILITTRPSFNIIASKYARREVTVIGQEHLNITIYPEGMKKSIEKNYGRLDYVATLTDEDTRDYQEMLKGGKTKVIKLTNSIPKLENGEATLESKTIISAGRLVPQKGFDLLIDSFELLKDSYPDWKVKIYGKGRDKAMLQDMINKKGLYNHVVLMGATNAIEEEFRKSSIFALSSRYEGFGMVIVESMQCGVPVVSFDCPRGPGEIINNGYDGILVDDGDIEKFAEALKTLMDSRERRLEIRDNALKSVERYSIEKIGKQWVDLIQEIEKESSVR